MLSNACQFLSKYSEILIYLKFNSFGSSKGEIHCYTRLLSVCVFINT